MNTTNTKESLKDRIARLKAEKELADNPVSVPDLVEPLAPQTTEKSTPLQSTANAIKNDIDTNIRELNKNPATGVKTSLQAILAAKKLLSTPKTAFTPLVAPIIADTKLASDAVIKTDTVEPTNVKTNLAISLLDKLKKRGELVEVETKEETPEAKLINPAINPTTNTTSNINTTINTSNTNTSNTKQETFSLNNVLNEKQRAAVGFAEMGKSFVLLGAAGTGKTSSEGAILHKILASDKLTITKVKAGGSFVTVPSVVVCAYTRRAAANSAKAILKDPILKEKLTNNIMTIHALLEFVPEYYTDAEGKERFAFRPTRNKASPLEITHLIIEEATLVGLDLWEQLYDALPYGVQIIFVGDINQLPPVFGPSILNHAITKLPVVELTQVYRQAEGSPIINNAHAILEGKMITNQQNEQGVLKVITGKNDVKVGQDKTYGAFQTMFKQFFDAGIYNPEEDMILSPWNKQKLGTDSMNSLVAEFLSIKNNSVVHEVIAGFNKLYLSINDKVIVNKRDAIIVGITSNPAYVGKVPQYPGTDLSRYGFRRLGQHNDIDLDSEVEEGEFQVSDYDNFSIDSMADEETERKMQASHSITVAFEDGYTSEITAAGDLAPSVFSLGYAMTVHKSQGSEWRRVFIIFHPDHSISLSREMLYTAITRAREEVYILAKQYVLDKAVVGQRVKGNTLADKIAIFNSGLKETGAGMVHVTKEIGNSN